MTGAHPSRSAPICGACKHLLATSRLSEPHCNHPSTPVSLVTGLPEVPVSTMRRGRLIQTSGLPATCGMEGKLFEARQKTEGGAA